MNGVAVGGLTLVGAFEMRSSLLPAFAAVGAFGFVISVLGSWQDAGQGHRLWWRAAAFAMRAVVTLMTVAGTIAALEGLHTAWGLLALTGWWALRPRRRRAPVREPRPGIGAGGRVATDVDDLVRRFASAPLARLSAARLEGGAARVEALARSLDDGSLARAWAECRAAGEPADAAQKLELAMIRGALLDELERRDPVAFASWLARGAPDGPPLPTRRRT
jgi:hypothetical protein